MGGHRRFWPYGRAAASLGLLRVFVLGLLVGLACAARSEDLVPEPDGYRMGEFRSLVPETVQGGRAIATEEAKAIHDAGNAVFIDVLPQSPRPPNLPAGTIFREKPRFDIPGSIWLPDTGYGELAPVIEAWFRGHMMRSTGNDMAKPVVIYCLADCWMSYNAAKRLAAWGYTSILWYRDGTTGWEKAGLPLEERKPTPRPQ